MDDLTYQLQILATKYNLNPSFIQYLVKNPDKMTLFYIPKNKKKKKSPLPLHYSLFIIHYSLFLGIPALPTHNPTHAVGLVPGFASLPYSISLRSIPYRLRRPPHPSRAKPHTRFF
jgi:hypothetical protein